MYTITGGRVSVAGVAEAAPKLQQQRSDILEGEGLRSRRVDLGRFAAAAPQRVVSRNLGTVWSLCRLT